MKVTVFSTTLCGSCRMVKQYLQHKGIPYEEINLDHSPDRRQEAYDMSGAFTVPVTRITTDDRTEVVVGYNIGRLSEALA
jgi:glutaredoxin